VISLLFGTDGIRGEVLLDNLDDKGAIDAILKDRKVTKTLLRLVGEALSRHTTPGDSVIIGWDNRPANPDLVSGLTQGLHLGGCQVIQGGICATPGLHNALLETKSKFGCMITASHNPVIDSGIKIFDSAGFKTTPQMEMDLSELVYQLAAEEREVDLNDLEFLAKPDNIFNADFAHQELLVIRLAEFTGMFGPPEGEFLLDCSKGAGSHWLAQLLSHNGVKTSELSHDAPALNDGCGAGELSPTDSWTWLEAARSDHLLVRSVQKTEPGKIIGAALDGDGDRCLFLVSVENGCKVMDGDSMADHILRAGRGRWHLAASIESDLALSTSLDRLEADVSSSQTAVGDRWLSCDLRSRECSVLGVEDSGHLVMSTPHPHGGRALVGDGAASLFAVLCAIGGEQSSEEFIRGFKHRVSIKDADRSLWTGSNDLAVTVEKIAADILGDIDCHGLEGEPNLMMLEKDGISIGIRNSGTQAKTNVSLRIAPGIDGEKPKQAAQAIIELLRIVLT
jgi:phosphoglucosamine mutase